MSSEPRFRFRRLALARFSLNDDRGSLADGKDLNLTNIPVDSYHLEGLLEPVTFDADGGDDHVLPTRLETLVLDSTKIDDRALLSLGTCRKLRALHVAETRITRMSS